eukprot:g10104.t1
MTQATQPAADTRQSPPAVKRKTCLRISTSPPVDSAANANKRMTPSNIAATAGSSSVVASKGMLFSRAELRPAPLSASRKYDSNAGFGSQSSETMSGSTSISTSTSTSTSTSSLGGLPAGDQLPSTGNNKNGSRPPLAPGRANFNTGSSSTSLSARSLVRPSERFATLRFIEARRRAAWSLESSPRASSSSPPPPSLAALGSRSAASYRRRSPNGGAGSTTARKSPSPPLPKMKSFGPASTTAAAAARDAAAATAAATATAKATDRPPPLPPRRTNNPQLFLSAAYAGSSGLGAVTTAAEVVAAPLSEPAGRDKDHTRKTLEQKWAAWQLENQLENQRGPAPNLGKPAPAPSFPGSDRSSFGECGGGGGGGGGGRKSWGGVGDFHDKVAFLGDYVASVFGRAKRGMSVPRRYDGGVQVQYGVE